MPLPFNRDILSWANETREILSCATVPPNVKFYNIYGTSLDTPHSVWYNISIFSALWICTFLYLGLLDLFLTLPGGFMWHFHSGLTSSFNNSNWAYILFDMLQLWQ